MIIIDNHWAKVKCQYLGSDKMVPVERVKSNKNLKTEYKTNQLKNKEQGVLNFNFKNNKIKNINKLAIIKYGATGCLIIPLGQVMPQGSIVSDPWWSFIKEQPIRPMAIPKGTDKTNRSAVL